MLREGLYFDAGEMRVNFTYLNEENYFDVFEYDDVMIPDFQYDDLKKLVNYVIRTVVTDDRALDRQISFITDTRNKRRCTHKQIEYLLNLLKWHCQYFLNEKQISFLSHQRICVISKLISLFQNTIFYSYSV